MRRAFTLFVLAATLCTANFLSATAQIGDNLLLNGKKYSINTNPLQPFLKENPNRLPKNTMFSTALWRGYIATWKVEGGRLLLSDVVVPNPEATKKDFPDKYRSVMSDVFPGQTEVFAEWFTGHVIIPDGKLVNYVHMGYASIYEKYILLRVERGNVTRTWTADRKSFTEFSERQFALFKQTEEYRKALAESEKEDRDGGTTMSAADREEFLRQYYSEHYMAIVFDSTE